jgi:hypothetical protein
MLLLLKFCFIPGLVFVHIDGASESASNFSRYIVIATVFERDWPGDHLWGGMDTMVSSDSCKLSMDTQNLKNTRT